MRLLTFSTLYPNKGRPNHGVFVEQRLRHLCASGAVQATVIAPVPWFPFEARVFGSYASFAHVPKKEVRHEIEVWHPRYPVIPKVGMSAAPFLMALGVFPTARRLCSGPRAPDVIDAHYLYPDGVAAAYLGCLLGLPVVMTARGTDVNLLPRYFVPRHLIRWACRRSAGIVTVSRALKKKLTELDLPADRIEVLPNGLDLDRFRPLARMELRTKFAFNETTLLSVGNLIELKGHHIAIAALERLKNTTLVIVGQGKLEGRLKRLAEKHDVAQRVTFAGAVPHESMPEYYNAADILVLPSSREGLPNVVLESLGCGTPVVATAAGGIPEVITSPVAGELMHERTAPALANAVERLMSRGVNREATRTYAERFSWEGTTQGQLELFGRIVRGKHKQ